MDGFSPEERRDLLVKLLAGLPEVSGPMPPDRWMHLTDYQREFLAGKSRPELERLNGLSQIDPDRLGIVLDLDEEDIEDLREAIRFARSLRTTGRFLRWVVITVVAIVGGMITLKNQFPELIRWITGGKG